MNVSVSRSAKLAAFILVVAPLLFTLNARPAGPGYRACAIEDHPAAQGDLEDGQQDVLSRFGRFDYGSMQYRFEALSLWGFDQPKPDKTCLRYEIKNLSGQKIEAVVWKDGCRREWCWNLVTRSPAFREYLVRRRGQSVDRWALWRASANHQPCAC